MIEAGRKAVYADKYDGYGQGAFEQAIKNLDRNAIVTFSGKHFALTGFGIYEKGVIAEIEKRGGIVHSSMVKMADYLIVCLESPGAAKVKKALEWRQKGVSNLIVSDYQMWRAIFGIEDAIISDKDETLIGEDATPAAMVAADSIDAKEKTSPVEAEKLSAIEMKPIESETETPEATPLKENEAKSASTDFSPSKRDEKWFREYGEYVEKDPQIEFKDKIFVFDPRTKTSNNAEEVVDCGGVIRQGVSSKTDYLVVSPECDALTTLRKTIELKKKGNKVKIVTEEDFRAAIDRIPIIAPEGYSVAEDGTLDLSSETEIRSGAFKANKELKAIRIPEGVTHIGDYAFNGCENLETIELPETLISIGGNAFWNCKSLTSVTFNEELEKIGLGAFHGCKSLTSVTFNDGLEEIGQGVFSDCKSLTSVTFNEGLKGIGINAFQNCKSLTSVTFNEGLEKIGKWAFYGCESLTRLTFNVGLKEIGEDAFIGCKSLQSVTFNGKLEIIGKNAFGLNRIPVCRMPESMRGWAMENKIEEMFQRIEYFPSARNSTVKLQQSSAQQPWANSSVGAGTVPSHKEERKKQIQMQIVDLNREYNEASGFLNVFKRRKIRKQIEQLCKELNEIEQMD